MTGAPRPTSSTALLRPLRWWDLPQACELEDVLFGEDRWSEETYWSELALCAPTLGEPPARCYLALVDASGLVGYGGVAVAGDEAFVQTLGVAPRAQGAGLGRRLTEALLDTAQADGATTCWLEVRTDNVPALRLYASLGFEQHGLRRGYYQPSGADAFVMRARLPADRAGRP